MSTPSLDELKQAILEAGLEIYRSSATEIRVAERVRMHLMDSGITVAAAEPPCVRMTVRSQRSDFPSADPEELFEKVRRALRQSAEARGFRETGAVTREITDPVDASQVLDVWHEVTFAKEARTLDALIDDVRWALQLPKCVDR